MTDAQRRVLLTPLTASDRDYEDACLDDLLDELMAQYEDRPASECDWL